MPSRCLMTWPGFVAVIALLIAMTPHPDRPADSDKIHPVLQSMWSEADDADHAVRAWVFFTDKGFDGEADRLAALAALERTYNQRALERRRLRGDNASRGGALVDVRDLPVARAYINAVLRSGAQERHTSRWLNAISVELTAAQTRDIAALPFVRSMQPVARGERIDPLQPHDAPIAREGAGSDYGNSFDQLQQINLIALHEAGFTGDGVIIGVLDTGFQRSHEAFNHIDHPLSVITEYDFVDDDGDTSIEAGDPSGQHAHGTLILGALGAYMPGTLLGAAYDASFVLCKTEDTTQEVQAEEDSYVAGLEFIEANGADVATASLGYIAWYTQNDLDGATAVTTIAVNTATDNGLHCCNAAGNSGHDSDPQTSHLIAPADALKVITCGAVDSTGVIAGFSSDGPTADGRLKPEVLARGIQTHTVSAFNDDGYTTTNGTSLSTPLIAGAVTCLVQARPTWSVDEMRANLTLSANDYIAAGTTDPLFIRGYGVINAYEAAQDCNDNGLPDIHDVAQMTSDDLDGNGVPDECQCAGDVPGVSPGSVDVSDLLAVLGGWGETGPPRPDADIAPHPAGDGMVTVDDLLLVLGTWGQCP